MDFLPLPLLWQKWGKPTSNTLQLTTRQWYTTSVVPTAPTRSLQLLPLESVHCILKPSSHKHFLPSPSKTNGINKSKRLARWFLCHRPSCGNRETSSRQACGRMLLMVTRIPRFRPKKCKSVVFCGEMYIVIRSSSELRRQQRRVIQPSTPQESDSVEQ